jgi:hypothetical protein
VYINNHLALPSIYLGASPPPPHLLPRHTKRVHWFQEEGGEEGGGGGDWKKEEKKTNFSVRLEMCVEPSTPRSQCEVDSVVHPSRPLEGSRIHTHNTRAFFWFSEGQSSSLLSPTHRNEIKAKSPPRHTKYAPDHLVYPSP